MFLNDILNSYLDILTSLVVGVKSTSSIVRRRNHITVDGVHNVWFNNDIVQRSYFLDVFVVLNLIKFVHRDFDFSVLRNAVFGG